MKTKILFLLWLLPVALLWHGCQNESKTAEEKLKEEIESATENVDPQDALKNLEKAMENYSKDKGIKEVVNFRELKELLPDKLAGLPKTDDGGETSGIMGVKVSFAEGTYEKGDKRIQLNITDTGGFGAAMMGIANWSTLTIDRESDEGYERTTTIDGYKAFEKYESANKNTEIAVIVDDRFIVTLNGDNLNPKDVRDALKQIPLKKLK